MNENIAVIIMFVIILGTPIFVIGLLLGANIREKELKKHILNWENVLECFKDVDWTVTTFESYSGNVLTAKNGESKFYTIKSIDKAIEKLNSLDRTNKR